LRPGLSPTGLTALVDGTWPAAEIRRAGPWTLRRSAGGGSRVNAATAAPGAAAGDIPAAEAAMRDRGQPPLFCLCAGEAALDAALAARGYAIKDPTELYVAGTAGLARAAPGMVYALWPPLAIQAELWAEGGIGTARRAIMARAPGPRTALLGRIDGRPAAAAFVAASGGRAMLHALEVAPAARRRGLGAAMVRAAAAWAGGIGAAELAILVTSANTAGNSLYASLGAVPLGGYHYRA